jgi:hypothetical protein
MTNANNDTEYPSKRDYSLTHRGTTARRITDSDEVEPRLALTEVLWLFVVGTVPFMAVFGFIHWFNATAIVAKFGFWITAIPLAVALPLAVTGSVYRLSKRHHS